METNRILYVAIARTSLKKILLQYQPDKSEKRNLSLVALGGIASTLMRCWSCCRFRDSATTTNRLNTAAGTLNSTPKLNCALAVKKCLRVVLTTVGFPVDKALLILSEIQTKIYENFPKIRMDDEEEKLSGAKIYVSNVCFKYAAGESAGEPRNQRRMQDIEAEISASAKANPGNIQLSQPGEEATYSADRREESKDVVLRRKITLAFFIVLCVVYFITMIVDVST
eukprot:TRINITY_DN2814_c0_g1_i5.p1 TRINITY_DN2814_c0_g1~~TRINITY_DN2814_c0_g1_i5.p1  ORF type:complete len:226 (-),score=55.05 TRINITY_DN2814_c0_g1_i5:114-791(-)